GIVHGDVSRDSAFVSPRDHVVGLFGGWWYAAHAGLRLSALPGRTVAALPAAVIDARHATPRITLTLIRLLGRELLGDETGTRLAPSPAVPGPLAEWLRLPPPESALADYADWQTVLTDSFGPRRFAELPVLASDIYRKGS